MQIFLDANNTKLATASKVVVSIISLLIIYLFIHVTIPPLSYIQFLRFLKCMSKFFVFVCSFFEVCLLNTHYARFFQVFRWVRDFGRILGYVFGSENMKKATIVDYIALKTQVIKISSLVFKKC